MTPKAVLREIINTLTLDITKQKKTINIQPKKLKSNKERRNILIK